MLECMQVHCWIGDFGSPRLAELCYESLPEEWPNAKCTPKTPLYINAQSENRLFWCLTGLCGNWAWLCMAAWPATEPVTSSSGYSHQCQLQGSRNRRRLELQEQLCAPNTLTYIFAFMSHSPVHTDFHQLCTDTISNWLTGLM